MDRHALAPDIENLSPLSATDLRWGIPSAAPTRKAFMKNLPSHPNETADPFVYRKSHAYRQAFENYIRYGEPIRLFEAKAREGNRPTTHYIWRTQGDSKVRPSHPRQ